MGAKEVVQPEFEAALELSRHLLITLGEVESHIYNVITDIRTNRYRTIRPESESVLVD
jgi:monovalent cation:H+ antiporter-2, CPA2 family